MRAETSTASVIPKERFLRLKNLCHDQLYFKSAIEIPHCVRNDTCLDKFLSERSQ